MVEQQTCHGANREIPRSRNGLVGKCLKFTKAEELRRSGLYPYFRCIQSAQDTEISVGGKNMLMLGSNSYLGLTNHGKIKEKVIEAVKRYGSGCAGSRFLNGTLKIHLELEERLADFVGKEAALAFSTGFQANLGAIDGLAGKGDAVVIDKTDHASIVDGCRMSFARMLRYRHNDLADLERVLANCDVQGKLIVFDGIFSMEGDIAPLPQIVRLAEKYDAAVMTDDAHALGVLGEHGGGTAEHFGLTGSVDLIMGTFSKSLASVGGFIAARREVVDYLMHHARSLIFSASLSPANCAAVLGALEIMDEEPERRIRLWENSSYLRKGLQSMGLDTGASVTPIIPLMVRDNMRTFRLWRVLHDKGIFVNAVVPPAVAPSQSLLRLSLMATHTRKQLERALETIEKAAREVDLI